MNNKNNNTNKNKRVVSVAEIEYAATRIMKNDSSSRNSKLLRVGRVIGKNNNGYEKTKQRASRLIIGNIY